MQELLEALEVEKIFWHVVKNIGHKACKINEGSVYINQILSFKAEADLPQNE